MEDILYINSATDVRIKEMVEIIPGKDKELPNLIILTILSAGAGLITPVFSKDASGTTVFASIDEIGTKFILDGKEITSDDFLVTTGYITYFGLHFKDSNEHTLKVSLVNSTINQNTFQSNNYLTKVIIGTSITSIGDYAFPDCSSLTSVTIPNSVTKIGEWAFSNCEGLTSVTIPNSVTSISDYTFQGCSGLTSLTIPNSVTEIGESAFQNCSGLTSLTIGYSVATIGNNAFKGCSGLTQVTIPDSVTEIGRNAFKDCTGLTSVTIGNSVTTIDEYTFEGCSGLTSMVVEDGNSKYDSRNNCNAIIETATNTLISGCKNTIIPNTVTSIGKSAFSDCSGLTSITIPDSVTKIGEWAFSNCEGLTSVTIGNSVTEIGLSAFYGCSSLTSVIIPNSVTKIRAHVFDETAWYNNQPNGVVYAGKVAYIYKGTMPNGTVIELIDGCIGIAELAFSYRTGLTSVTIPNLVTEIGSSAFSGCSGLTSITSLATTAPTIYSTTFQNIKTSGTLHVPAGSDYSAWMSTSNYYLGKYNWTKVEDA